MNFFDLPYVVLNEIFAYLTYDEIAKKRIVSRRFNELCSQLLNSGFNKATTQHADLYKRIKCILPRRESERRQHFLARHAEILNSLETRISMLSMTYSKYIDRGLCCFIPGKVLDELMRVLQMIAKTQESLRPHEILQELRDLSSMAIEHFDEHYTDKYNAIILARGREQQQQQVVMPGLADISFNGMNNSFMNEHSYAAAGGGAGGAANANLPQAPLAAPYNAVANYYGQPQAAAGGGDGQNAANNAYYAYSPEDMVRQRLNHLLYLPNQEFLQYLMAVPPSNVNNNYDPNYWNRYSTNRAATIEELNNLSLYCSAMQLKVTETVGSLNALVRQLQKELTVKNEQITKLEARIASVDKLHSKVSHLSHKMKQKFGEVRAEVKAEVGGVRAEVGEVRAEFGGVKAEVGGIKADVEQQIGEVAANVEQQIGEVRAEVGGVKAEVGGVKAEVGGVKAEVGGVKAEVGGVKADVEQLNSNVEQQIDEVRAEVAANVEQLNSNVEQINSNVLQMNVNVEQQFDEVRAELEANVEQQICEVVEIINSNVDHQIAEVSADVEQKFGEVVADVQRIKQANSTVEQRIVQVQDDVEQITTNMHVNLGVVQKFGDVAVHVVQKFGDMCTNFKCAQIQTQVDEMKHEIQNKTNLAVDVKTELSSDIKRLTDNVDSIIDEVRTELCSNILQIREEIRTKQHFPGTGKAEAHTNGQCCAKCCAYKANLNKETVEGAGAEPANATVNAEQAEGTAKAGVKPAKATANVDQAKGSSKTGPSTSSGKKRQRAERGDNAAATKETPKKRSCPNRSAGHLTKSLDPHTGL